jgi:amphi-Trp domain-containing protein
VDLQLGQSEIQVHVPDQLAAEFEVEVEGDEVEIELEFSWSKQSSRARASRRSGAAR